MSSKAFYFGTNTKMCKNSSQTEAFVRDLVELTADINGTENPLFVIPSFTTIERARKSVPVEMLKIGAQNIYWEEEGQYTGEVSVTMLTDINTDLVMVAHSERRQMFGETDSSANKKNLIILRNGLIALYCVGESAEQKVFGITDEVLITQLKVGLNGIHTSQLDRLWIAYEPVWAIGVAGKPAEKEHVDHSHCLIHKTLEELFGEAGARVPVLYGGSVNLANSREYSTLKSVDGLFIGRSAWDAQNFSRIIHEISQFRKSQSQGE